MNRNYNQNRILYKPRKVEESTINQSFYSKNMYIRFDLDIRNYSVWPIYEDYILKESDHSMRVACKILASPKQIRHVLCTICNLYFKVFGKGSLPSRNSDATREYDF